MATSDEQVIVTLIVPCLQGAPWIATCLRSIAIQSLDRSAFEVIVVVNGEPDESPEIVEQIFATDPALNYRVVFAEQASLANARNVGIELARGSWVTWVDVDDWISPNYLAELTDARDEGTIPLARVLDVDEVSGKQTEPLITHEILTHTSGRADPTELWRPLTFAACKLLPTHLARQLRFDTELKSGEDVAYFAQFMALNDLVFDTSPAHNGAAYYRLVRSGSMSRQAPNYAFSVTDRIAVMKHLDGAIEDAPAKFHGVMNSMIRSQARFISRYLDACPEEFPRVRTDLTEAGLRHTPWERIASRTPNLAILYDFTPSLDAERAPAWTYLSQSGRHWNIISNEIPTLRPGDQRGSQVIKSAISRRRILNTSPTLANWPTVEDFCTEGLDALAELEHASGPQTNLYSHAMWPTPHLFAALLKARRGNEVHWTAEFSHSLSRDAGGARRTSESGMGDLYEELRDALVRSGFPISETASLFEWAEHVALALGDRLIFASSGQLDHMLRHPSNTELAQKARARASIAGSQASKPGG